MKSRWSCSGGPRWSRRQRLLRRCAAPAEASLWSSTADKLCIVYLVPFALSITPAVVSMVYFDLLMFVTVVCGRKNFVQKLCVAMLRRRHKKWQNVGMSRDQNFPFSKYLGKMYPIRDIRHVVACCLKDKHPFVCLCWRAFAEDSNPWERTVWFKSTHSLLPFTDKLHTARYIRNKERSMGLVSIWLEKWVRVCTFHVQKRKRQTDGPQYKTNDVNSKVSYDRRTSVFDQRRQ